MNSKINILIVDGQPVVREGVRQFFADDLIFEVLGEAYDGYTAFQMIEQFPQLDVIITDQNLERLDGASLIKKVKVRFPNIRFLVFTDTDQTSVIKKSLAVGADGYLLKTSSKFEVINAVREIYIGKSYYSNEIARKIAESIAQSRSEKKMELVKLTKRELEVLRMISLEKSNKEIADELGISQRTVDAHKRNLIEKTGSKNIIGTVLYAINHQLVEG